jgi:acetolactate synthase I/II/III large subunit
MSERYTDAKLGRRSFLKGATVASAAAATMPLTARAQTQTPAPTQAQTPPRNVAPRPNPALEQGASPPAQPLTESSAGSDFMLDVIKTLDIEYLAANPGTSFRGLHESVINYGHNKMPEFLTCMHEEAAVAMAHGYSKVAYKPMLGSSSKFGCRPSDISSLVHRSTNSTRLLQQPN